MTALSISEFIEESNAIEGITRGVTSAEIDATQEFLSLKEIAVSDMVKLVQVYQPDALLRDELGMDVRVGDHVPPAGTPNMKVELLSIILDAVYNAFTPYSVHSHYQSLHPFTDGNGRSGRALWLWQMKRFHGGAPLGFLHTFYYQTLRASDG